MRLFTCPFPPPSFNNCFYDWDESWWQHRGNTSDIISIRSVHHHSWYYVMPKGDKERAARSCAMLARWSLNNSCSPAETQVAVPRFWPAPLFLHGHLSEAESSPPSEASRLSHVSYPCWEAAPTGRRIISTYVCVCPCVCGCAFTNSGQSVPCEKLWPCTQLDGPALCIERQLGSFLHGDFFSCQSSAYLVHHLQNVSTRKEGLYLTDRCGISHRACTFFSAWKMAF